MPLAPRERFPLILRVPRHLLRVAPVPTCPLACRGGDQFSAGPFLVLHICPTLVFIKNLTSKCHNFYSTYPFCTILFPTRS
ncbi:hypothetical protein Hanom_Chr14g01317921 [Helianthus anomalus]